MEVDQGGKQVLKGDFNLLHKAYGWEVREEGWWVS